MIMNLKMSHRCKIDLTLTKEEKLFAQLWTKCKMQHKTLLIFKLQKKRVLHL